MNQFRLVVITVVYFLFLGVWGVEAFGAMEVSPQRSAGFSGNVSAGFSPGLVGFTILNNGAVAAPWAVTSGANWMQLSPTSGTLAPGATVEVKATLNALTSLLEAGIHSGTVTFSDGQTRNVPLLVDGVVATLFEDGFEASALGGEWAKSGTGTVNVESGTPHTGAYSEVLTPEYYRASRSELTLSLNLDGQSDLALSFWARSANNMPHGPPPSPFVGGADFDGVAVSVDGVTWFEVQSLRSLPERWTEFSLDLDAALAAHGLAYGPHMRVRFNHFGLGGNIQLDDVRVEKVVPQRLRLALPSSANEGAALSTGTVFISPVRTVPTTVALAAGEGASVPATVEIPANAASATFLISTPSDGVLDGTEEVVISANVIGFRPGFATLAVHDSQSAVVSLSLPPSVAEGGGITGTISLSAPAGKALQVGLSAAGDELSFPRSVEIPQGAAAVTFYVSSNRDSVLEGPETVTLTAHVANWTDGTASVAIADISTSPLSIQLPERMLEGSGTGTAYVFLAWTTDVALVVTLSSSDTTEATVPATVTIPAGASYAGPFQITVIDDAMMDGPQAVTITASAAGVDSGSKTGEVEDNELHHLSFSDFAPTQVRNAPIRVTISACDISDSVIENFAGTLALSVSSPGGGNVPVSPAAVTLVGGKWTGDIALGADTTSAFILATHASGNIAVSNEVQVALGTLHHFAFAGIPAQPTMDVPFALTVSAVDAGGNVISGYNGPVTLQAVSQEVRAPVGTAKPNYYYDYTAEAFNLRYATARVETIYLPSEVHGAGFLGSMALNFTEVPSYGIYHNFTVRLKHRPPQSGYYDYYDEFDATGWTEVYRGDVQVTATGWLEFPFSVPFQYDGVNNLVVDLSFYDPSDSFGSGGRIQTTVADADRSISDIFHSRNDDPTAPYYPLSGRASKYLPNVRFSTAPTMSPIRPQLPIVLSGGTWNGPASIPFVSERVAITAADGAGVTGESSMFSVGTLRLPQGAGVIASEDWETGVASSAWAFTHAQAFTTQYDPDLKITTADQPHGGTQHLAFDRTTSLFSYNVLNEATWTLDLTGQSGLTLKLWAKSFNETLDSLSGSSSFTNYGQFDGVAISANGTNWYIINNFSTITTSWGLITVDLDSAIRSVGLTYGPGFKIRFNQYRPSSTSRGIVIDDIEVVSTPKVGATLVTLPAQVSEGGTPATGSVSIPFAVASATLVILDCGAPAKVFIPPTVTIPAGQTSAPFSIQVLDDAIIDGNKIVAIKATAPNFPESGTKMLILDNDIPTFTLNVTANSVAENGAPLNATVSIPVPAAVPLTFTVASSNTTAFTALGSVMIPQGATSITFPVSPVNDTKIDGPQSATLTVSFAGQSSQVASITVLDDETMNLSLTPTVTPATTTMVEGLGAATFTAKMSGSVTTATTISFSSSSPRISAPAAATIAAGSRSASITFTVLNDTITGSDETVTLTASAPGFVDATFTLTVLENDPHHFDISPIASPQIRGADIPVTITARDAAGAALPGFAGSISLSGTATVSPAALTGTVGGVWAGKIRVNDVASGVILTVNDGSGHTGNSNPFDTIIVPFSEYRWDAIAPQQTPSSTIPITVRATDAGGNLDSGINGPVTVRAMSATARTRIGDGTYDNGTNLYTYAAQARCQTLFTAEELGSPKALAGFVWTVTDNDSNQVLSKFTVRVKPTTRAEFVNGDVWDTDGWTVVHQSTVTIGANGPLPILFDVPYDYDGLSNLILDVSFNNPSSGDFLYWQADTHDFNYKTLYGYAFTATGDPLTWGAATVPIYASGRRTHTEFLSLTPVNTEISSPTAISNGLWTGTVAFPGPQDRMFMEVLDATGLRRLSNAFQVTSPSIVAQVPFSDGFETGALAPHWQSSTTDDGRVRRTYSEGPHSGSYHAVLDSLDSTSSREELTLTVDLAGASSTMLVFWVKVFVSQDTGPPAAPFVGGADFDGVAMSADGTNWYEIQPLRSMTVGAWTQFAVNLDAAIATRGLAYNGAFKLRFNHYGYYAAPSGGMAIDDISITANFAGRVQFTLPATPLENSGSQPAAVAISAAAASDTVIALTSSSPLLVSVPAQVTIPAGQTSAPFNIVVGNNAARTGPITVTVTGSIGGNAVGQATTKILDDEETTLAVFAPATVAESYSSVSVNCVVSISAVSDAAQIIYLSSSLPSVLSVPAQVVILPGQVSASFTATIPSNSAITGPQTVTITASAEGRDPASTDVIVSDYNTLRLTVSAYATITEGATYSSSLSAGGIISAPLTVALSASNPSRLSVPATVVIPAGASSVSFNAIAVENVTFDGSAAITVTATADGATSHSVIWTIRDNDLHHFTFNPIGPKVRGSAFSATVSARAVDDVTISSYAGTVNLSATGDAGAIAFSPATMSLSSGSGTASITISTFSNNVRLAATSGAITGISEPFTVGTGAPHHYTWGAIPTSQTAGKPFTATLSAFDIANNPATESRYLQLSIPSTERTIGTGTATSSLFPLATNYHDERTQAIYLASELGSTPLTLSSLSLYVETLPGQTLNTWTIRMKHSGALAWESTGWTTVYSANQTIAQTGWVKFNFTTPFSYNGTSTLAVDFSFNNVSLTTAGSVRTYTATSARTIYSRLNSTLGDPRLWDSSIPPFGPSATSTTAIPQVIFNQGALPTNPPIPGVIFLQNGVWTGSISFAQAGSMVLTAKDFEGISATTNSLTISAAADADADRLPDWWETANTLTGNATGDADNDGASNFLEYALNSNPKAASPNSLPAGAVQMNPADGQNYLTFSYRRRIGVAALTYTVLTSSDCIAWTSSAAEYQQVGAIPMDDGVTETVLIRVLPALGAPGNTGKFVRLQVAAP